MDNDEEDGDRSLGVQATASGGSAQTVITILDDETLIQSIELSVNPTEIREDAGATEVTITAILIGKALDEDVILLFQTDASTAIRDVDYERPGISLTIPAGQTQGSGTVTITPIDDETEEPNETITLRVASNPQKRRWRSYRGRHRDDNAERSPQARGAAGRRYKTYLCRCRRRSVGHGWYGDCSCRAADSYGRWHPDVQRLDPTGRLDV